MESDPAHDPNLVTSLRHHADEPTWNATRHAFELASMVATIGYQKGTLPTYLPPTIRACPNRGNDWQPEPSPIVLPFGQADMESDPTHNPSLVANLRHHADKPTWNAIRHAFELVSMVASIGYQKRTLPTYLPPPIRARPNRLI